MDEYLIIDDSKSLGAILSGKTRMSRDGFVIVTKKDGAIEVRSNNEEKKKDWERYFDSPPFDFWRKNETESKGLHGALQMMADASTNLSLMPAGNLDDAGKDVVAGYEDLLRG